MYQVSKKGTSIWLSVDKETFELYQQKPFSRLWKTKKVKSTPPLPEVENEKPKPKAKEKSVDK